MLSLKKNVTYVNFKRKIVSTETHLFYTHMVIRAYHKEPLLEHIDNTNFKLTYTKAKETPWKYEIAHREGLRRELVIQGSAIEKLDIKVDIIVDLMWKWDNE